MLIKNKRDRIDIPHEEGQWLEVTPLSYGAREEARQVAKRRQWDEMAAVSKLAASLPEDMRKRKESAEPAERDQLDEYDAATVVDCAVTAWSYDEPVETPSEQLDAATMEWAARAILERNIRPPASGPESSTS